MPETNIEAVASSLDLEITDSLTQRRCMLFFTAKEEFAMASERKGKQMLQSPK